MIKKLFLLLVVLFSLNTNAQTISGTEAVEYDPTGNRFIISNGSSILQQNSGSSTLTFFGEGDADYGMEVIGNTLYSISGGFIQSVNAYDLTTEQELFNGIIPNSEFLNGMASDPSTNRIWITDFALDNIIEMDMTDIDNPTDQVVVSNTGCTPNGITHDATNNRLVFTCWSGGDIKAVDLDDYSVSTLVNTGLSQIDGIDHDENGNFYISSWSPTRITRLSNDFTVEETITAPGLSQPADISYAVAIDTLAIANSGNQTITYIYLGTNNIEEVTSQFQLSLYPNPVSDMSFVSFELPTASDCQMRILDQNGKLVADLLNEKSSYGNHKILLSGLDLSAGIYFCELRVNETVETLKFVVE